MTDAEKRRYARHIIIPEIGERGQRLLGDASVLVIGAGGLGSPVAYYLAAAGVGRIGIVDFDSVDESNLQRQILHFQPDIGRRKTISAKEKLSAFNPLVEVITHDEPFTSENALEVIRGYDIVADGTDNFPTRYLVNDACVLAGKMNVFASIFRFEGQVSVFGTPAGPCYRCLYPEPPPHGEVPSCAEAGVLGVLPGIVGCLQANEVIKAIVGIGEPLIGRLLFFDALSVEFREFDVVKSEECPVCGSSPSITELIDYDEFCGVPKPKGDTPEISVQELAKKRDDGTPFVLLDIREHSELGISRLEPCLHIPMAEVLTRHVELEKDAEIFVICKAGVRSLQITAFLIAQGFERVSSVAGGINAYSAEVDPSIPKY